MADRNLFILRRGFTKFFTATLAFALVEQLCLILDMILVGNFVAADAFAALELVAPYETITLAIFQILVGGSEIVASQMIGEQLFKKADKVLSSTLVLSAVTAFVIAALSLVFIDPLSSFLSPDESLRGYVKDYLCIFIPTLPFTAIFLIVSKIVNIDGKPGLLTLVSAAACAADILLDVLLMKGLGMGIKGQAWANLASYVLPLIILIPHLASSKCSFNFEINPGKLLAGLGELIKAGLPYALPFVLTSLLCYEINSAALSTHGAEGVYAWGAGYQVLTLGMMIASCVCDNILVTMGSMLHGCDDHGGLGFLVRNCTRLLAVIQGIIIIAVFCFPHAVVSMFGESSPEVLHACERPVKLTVLFLVPYTICYIKLSLLQALDKTWTSLLHFTVLFVMSVALVRLSALLQGRGFFLALPAAGLLYIVSDFVASSIIRKRHPDLSRYYLIPTPEKKRSFYESVPYTQEGLSSSLERLEPFLEGCDLSIPVKMSINLCCEELMMNIVEHNALEPENHVFDVYIREEDDCVKITFKDAGKPYNPVKKYDKTAAEAYLAGEEMNLSMQILNNMCHELSYNYMYGQNTVYMRFPKN